MSRDKVSEGTIFLGSFGVPKTISLYLAKGDQPALIESGPSSISNKVCERLDELGVFHKDIIYILLTHIHIDHAGGSWSLLERMPKARVMLHSKGVKHLIEPSQLRTPSSKVLGDLLKAWGEVRQVSTSQIIEVKDGQILDLDGLKIRIINAPGHTPNQIAFYDETNRVLFPGDAMGIYYSGIDAIIPASPSPNFDLAAAMETLQKLSNLNVDVVCLPHFGPVFDVKNFYR
jgi:glyoxylase-like metal-dependent hydrolase (beta-lactamase superfamily II)